MAPAVLSEPSSESEADVLGLASLPKKDGQIVINAEPTVEELKALLKKLTCMGTPDPKVATEKAEDSSSSAESDKEDDDEPEAEAEDAKKSKTKMPPVGMKCGIKTLYSGKEDRHGRFKWQEKKPDNLGQPVEDAKTAKWALLVRRVAVYNDPRRVQKIHSIVVQSPLLKKVLKKVLKGYPGITVTLERLEFSGKFEPLIHRWTEFETAIEDLRKSADKGKKSETLEHAELLHKILSQEFEETISSSRDMKSKGVINYEYLWTLFQPQSLIYCRQESQDRVFELTNARYGVDCRRNPCFRLDSKYVDFDGNRFGNASVDLSIYPWNGTRPITSLSAFPLESHPSEEKVRETCITRGEKFESLAGANYRAYNGIGWLINPYGRKEKRVVKGRVVIDTYGWNRFNPNENVSVQNFKAPTPAVNYGLFDDEEDDSATASDDESQTEEECEYDDFYDDGMPADGIWEDEDEAATRVKLTTRQQMLCTHLLKGYALKDKLWLNLFVGAVQEISYSTAAFENLVLPNNQKELIFGFTESQRKCRNEFDDIVQGKGKGIILLLCGPPGVGKTLTAESVAEEMKVPLYMMSAGDLGLVPSDVEDKLNTILEMCTRWNAILLLDEADVFLEQRSLHELERNKLVSIFLRVLEYYEGIMFLTTNRVSTFDAAFQSRIHISLDYPDLTIESRRQIWANFLKKAAQQQTGDENAVSTFTNRQLDQLSLMQLNGRQIKNILKTAQLLARRAESPVLKHEHIMTVLDVTQHLHTSSMETERQRSSIFC